MLKEVADLVTKIKAAWSQVPPESHHVGERVLVFGKALPRIQSCEGSWGIAHLDNR